MSWKKLKSSQFHFLCRIYLPFFADNINAVSLLVFHALTFAPFSISNSVTFKCPEQERNCLRNYFFFEWFQSSERFHLIPPLAANIIAVVSSLFAALTSAPRSRSNFTISKCPEQIKTQISLRSSRRFLQSILSTAPAAKTVRTIHNMNWCLTFFSS